MAVFTLFCPFCRREPGWSAGDSKSRQLSRLLQMVRRNNLEFNFVGEYLIGIKFHHFKNTLTMSVLLRVRWISYLISSQCLLVNKEKIYWQNLLANFYIVWVSRLNPILITLKNQNNCQNFLLFYFQVAFFSFLSGCPPAQKILMSRKVFVLAVKSPSNPQEPSHAGLSGTAQPPPLFLVTWNCPKICSPSQKNCAVRFYAKM